MRKITLEKKLNKLKSKIVAYEDAKEALYALIEEEQSSEFYKDAIESLLRVIGNMLLMCQMSKREIERKLVEAD